MAQTRSIILQGGGDHAQVVLDCLQALGENVIGIFDPKFSGDLFGVPQLGNYDASYAPEAKAIIAIGDNKLRKKVVQFTRHEFTSTIHSSVILSSRATVGVGSMLLHRAVIQANCIIGNHVIINTSAQVDHDCVIADFVHLAPGSVLCGRVSVGEGSFIGAGSVVIPGVKIGKWATIGAGTVVVRDVLDYQVVVGNPAHVIKQNAQ
jgi:sugar O-acyltransferase (sialic acid O-acetyltransferase NeuD family)